MTPAIFAMLDADEQARWHELQHIKEDARDEQRQLRLRAWQRYHRKGKI